MIKIIALILLWCHMSSGSFNSSLTRTFDALIEKTNPNLVVGVEIRSLPSGRVVYQKNPHTLIKPASLQKILSALVASLKLGSDYRFETTLSEKNGSIHLKFSGDPSFTLLDLEALFEGYKAKKGGTIEGDIIVTEPTVPTFPHGEGWSIESTRFLYGAPISVVNINKNVICFRLIPGKTVKEKPTILYDKDQPPYPMDNRAISAVCSDADSMERCDLDWDDVVSLKGCVPAGTPAFKVCLPVKEHRFKNYVRQSIQTALKRRGVILKGKIRFLSAVEKGYAPLKTHLSKPLIELLKEGMKDSDNTIMESVFIPFMLKNPERFRKSKSMHDFVAQALKDALRVDFSNTMLADGSGLSHHNLISPHHLADLLEKALTHKELGKYWFDLLSVAGKDGTLKGRLKALPKGVTVLGKTGTLTAVRNLAGYVLKDGEPKYLFVSMIQNFSGKEEIYEALEDKMVMHLANTNL